MSAITPPATAEDTPAPDRLGERRSARRRRRALIATAAVVLVAAGSVVVVAQPFGHGTANVSNAAVTSRATVTKRDLSSQTNVNGTLGYTGSYSVIGKAQGTITVLPAVGQVINQGDVVYDVDAKPVVLLYGSTPAYRSLSSGMTGPDVAQLNADLVALGYATSSQLNPTSDVFSTATAAALKRLQSDLGATKTGSLDVGQVVFLPTALRVTAVSAALGGAASGPVLTASSTNRVATVALDAAQASQINVGDQVSITLPGNKTTPGVVWTVGTVATTPSGGGQPTVQVEVVPTDPGATGSLDQTPVQVSIVTGTAKDAIVVPVNALLALAGGGYAIETVSARGVHHLAPVTLGLFDDAAGLVQVSSARITPGQRVVVPSA